MQNNILLLDNKDKEIGFEEKLKTHQKGLLHRAFSVLIFDSKGNMLIQRRAFNKYHSGGLWSNTCCSHQRKGELLDRAVHERLIEEMGFNVEEVDIEGKKEFEVMELLKLKR